MTTSPDEAAKQRSAPILEIWQHRNFALFMSGIGPYYITNWMQRVGVGWLAWELSHSPAWLGVIAAADLAPMLFLAPIGGAYVDRSDPVRIIKLCMNLMTLQAIILSTLTITGLITIELLFVLALFTGLILPFYSACRQTIVATSVPRTVFPSAIAMDSSFFHGSRFLGPAIAAFTIPWFGVASTFIANMCGTIIFFLFQSMMDLKPPDRSGKRRASLMSDVGAGFVYVYRHAGIWPIFILMTITSVAVRPLQDMLPGFADAVFNSGATGLAWLASAMGVGAMITSVLLAMRGTITGLTRICLAGCLVLALATYGFSVSNTLWQGVIFAVFVGIALNGMATATHTLIQNAVDDDMRGRVVGLYSLIYRGTPAVGALALGIIAEMIGLKLSFSISAAVCLLAFLLVIARAKSMTAALEIKKI